ncbi:hypothetical protein ACP4OV_012468 [Aristida adscensionis]
MADDDQDSTKLFLMIILAIILPPLGVFVKYGVKIEFWVSLVLTFFGYIPGMVYAILVIVKTF